MWIHWQSIGLTKSRTRLQTIPTVKRVVCLEILTESQQRFHVFQSHNRLQPWRIISRSALIAHCEVLQQQNENKIQNLSDINSGQLNLGIIPLITLMEVSAMTELPM